MRVRLDALNESLSLHRECHCCLRINLRTLNVNALFRNYLRSDSEEFYRTGVRVRACIYRQSRLALDLVNFPDAKSLPTSQTKNAQARREQELCQLAMKGVPLYTLGKSGHWMLGPLHIFTASGRWLNEQTGHRGRLNSRSMKDLLESEISTI